MRKLFLSILLVGVIIFNLNNSIVNAQNDVKFTNIGLGITANEHEHIDGEIQPYVEPACPYGVNHLMVSSGYGYAYYGSYPSNTLICGSNAWQCKNCLLVMITEGEPAAGQIIGTYATWSAGEKIGTYTNIYTTISGYCSSSTMSGYKFLYQ